ncbi:lasso peptide biosynthesis B2 protein [Pseudomonas batumici]|uniref:lasso peptide biosynthesis B2 protein n=1 Tax=Pseudomonas batumici TaxID=226910 RepID=UPI0030CFD703
MPSSSLQVGFAYYGRDLIVLTVADNKFHLIQNVSLGSVNDLISCPEKSKGTPLYTALHSIGAITDSSTPTNGCLSTLKPIDYIEQRWMTPLTSAAPLRRMDIIKALYALLRAAFCVRFGGFKRVMSVETESHSRTLTADDHDEILNRAKASLNKVFFLDFSKNKCLTYSLALTLILRRKIPSVKLIVGVRTRPFLSHAWVEQDNRVISDDPDLRNKLAVILEL